MAGRAKKSLQEIVGEFNLEYQNVPLELIDFDEQNPNELTPDLYEALKADIRDFGFWQPILVTPADGRFRMIDGEHRARIISELGGASIPAVIADEMTADQARMRLVTMNRFKGAFKPLPLAALLSGLKESFSETEIRQRIGMDEAQLRDTLALADFTDPGEMLRDDLEREREAAPAVMRFVVSQRDGEIIERVIASVANDKTDRGQALTKVCSAYEKANPKPKEKR